MAVQDGTHGTSDGMKCLCAELALGCACVCMLGRMSCAPAAACASLSCTWWEPQRPFCTIIQHSTSHHHEEELHVGNAHACRTTVHATTAAGQGWLVAHLCTSTCLLLLLGRQATLQKCQTEITQ